MDSYIEFLKHFNITADEFFKWGMEATIFPQENKVAAEWDALKKRLFSDEQVYIRGYGRDTHGTWLYKELYRSVFNNNHIEKDPSNNTAPHKLIVRLTDKKVNREIYNYQVSHIWGHTKNPLMFEAPWNICYTPKMFDPFTGHEVGGELPAEYKRIFLAKAHELYQSYIDEYNEILIKYDVDKHIEEFLGNLPDDLSEKEKKQFEKDVRNELSPISE